MTSKKNTLYQGRDWHSYRWAVAQALDTFDLLRDVCFCNAPAETTLSVAEHAAPLPSLDELYDDAQAHLATALAATIPADRLLASTEQQWLFCEVHWKMDALSEALAALLNKEETPSLQGLVPLIDGIKTAIQRLDV